MEEALYCIELPAEFFFYRIAVLEEVDQGGNSTIDPTPVDYDSAAIGQVLLGGGFGCDHMDGGSFGCFPPFLCDLPPGALDGA